MKIVLCENIDWMLSKEAFSIYASCMYHPSYEEYKAQIEDYLHDSSVKVFVCENHGKKTGMMVLKLTEAAAEIIGIAVSDNARRKGIGKQLIQRVIKSEEIERIKAQTDDGSIGFYRKCGFMGGKMMDVTQTFYDNIASQYDKLFLDWNATTQEQAVILNKIFNHNGFNTSAHILDCTCGIGTQAIGLAALGYLVTDADISDGELVEAKARAESLGVKRKNLQKRI